MILAAREQRLREREREERLAEQREREAAARAAEQKRRREWAKRNSEELARRRQAHEARDLQRWQQVRDALVARCGGQLPSVLAERHWADDGVFLHHEHWHALVYASHLHGRAPGQTFGFRDVCRTVFAALNEEGKPVRDGKRVFKAINVFLYRLRRERLIDFEDAPFGYRIDGPIEVRNASQPVRLAGPALLPHLDSRPVAATPREALHDTPCEDPPASPRVPRDALRHLSCAAGTEIGLRLLAGLIANGETGPLTLGVLLDAIPRLSDARRAEILADTGLSEADRPADSAQPQARKALQKALLARDPARRPSTSEAQRAA
jgi:hypothetical protein